MEWLSEERRLTLETELNRIHEEHGVDLFVVVWDRRLPDNQRPEDLATLIGHTWCPGGLWGTVLLTVSVILLASVIDDLILGLAAILADTLAGALLGAWIDRLRWRRTRWKLDGIGLHVRRGLLWHAEVLVPRSRVQHLDVERGPLERQFGLATLVVHTAGTQTHALRQSGLDDADAVALRDALIPDAARHVDAL
jgi:membrane protein YdbS with pleckstrin-like domain